MYLKVVDLLPLLAVFIAGSLALNQIRANNITNARIKWLENLKQLVSDFFSECTILILKEGVSDAINKRRELAPTDPTVQAYYDKINESIIDHLKIIESKHDLIKLNLNPKEDLHLKFEKLLDGYMDLLNKIPSLKSKPEFGELSKKMSLHSDTLILLSRFIIKLEWEKTKRSFFRRKYYLFFGKGRRILKEAKSLEIINYQ